MWCIPFKFYSPPPPTPFPPTVPFYLHRQQANQIKMALHSSQRSDRNVRIELAYDYLFVGGLKQAGKLLKRLYHGHDIYGIKKYHDLDPILGPRWHVRVLNKQMDFCYVILGTVQFHLHCQQSIPDFQPDQDPQDGLCNYVYFRMRRWCSKTMGRHHSNRVGSTILYRKKLKFIYITACFILIFCIVIYCQLNIFINATTL